ncbi:MULTISPECIES: YdeI/OmpD-associated family protein [unclassified Paenibacillus]|uniref:YdeI/OmpD-associated family protein n=1 Tax=unclassified Paenibacillus TaxID=185978 RepID=UPI00363F4691
MEAELFKKLRIQSGQRILLLNAPAGYTERLIPLPEHTSLDTQPEGTYDLVHLFVRSAAELEEFAPLAIHAVKYDALLWITYPKKSSKIKTDLSRDEGWKVISEAGYEGVALVSIDETWSAMRFRLIDLVKSTGARRERRALGAVGTAVIPTHERTLEIPDDLQHVLNENPQAKEFFDGLSFTSRKEYVRWVTDAKREETRTSRVAKSLEKLREGIKSPFIKA